ncbi:MAG: hypothetical protein DSO07_05255 [Thermoproteota archaeon]|nr:MAG: hypothetical protein DSO07_05255 [Candidatus Korarchaeota archaeon]
MEKSYLKALKEALEARMKEGGLPPRLELEENGEAIVRIADIIENPWRPGTKIYIVINLEDDLQYRLPVNAALYRILESTGAQIGDYLLLKYLGSASTKSGKTVKRWKVGYLSSEEASRIIGQSTQQGITHSTEQEKSEKKEPGPVSETPPTMSKEEISKFIEAMIAIYGFATLKDIDYYLNKVKKLNISVDEKFIQELGFKLQGDKVVK